MAGKFIALDWGTTSFRAYLVGPDGAVAEQRESSEGIMSVSPGGFDAVFERAVSGWDKDVPVLASGMVTSKQGWREVAYVAAPAGLAELTAGLVRFQSPGGRQIVLVPGVSAMAANGVPDVMRGEETQIAGAMAVSDGIFVTRGTHCKWVRVDGGRIVQFATFMTGELFAVLKAHSILGRLMIDAPDTASGPTPAFERGVAAGLAAERGGAGLLHALFSVRSLGLFEQIAGDHLADYLSGLLIGAEIAGGTRLFATSPGAVTVLGSLPLSAAFRGALVIAGIGSRSGPQDAAVRGLAQIGRYAGVIR